MAEIAIAATIIAGTVSTIATISSANAAKKEAETAAQMARLRAEAEAKDRQEELFALLATNNAISGTIGIDPSSRSFLAIQKAEKAKAEEDIKNIMMFGQLEARRYELRADQAGDAMIFGAFGGFARTVGTGIEMGIEFGKIQ